MASKKKGLAPTTNQPLQQQLNHPDQAPPSSTERRVGLSVTSTQFERYEGFIPPHLIAAYGDSELGRQYITEIIEQGRHRRHLEKTVIEDDLKSRGKGQYFAIFIALSFLVSGVWLVSTGHDAAGGTIATASVVGLVGAFLKASETRKTERIEKAKIMVGEQSKHDAAQLAGDQTPPLPGIDS